MRFRSPAEVFQLPGSPGGAGERRRLEDGRRAPPERSAVATPVTPTSPNRELSSARPQNQPAPVQNLPSPLTPGGEGGLGHVLLCEAAGDSTALPGAAPGLFLNRGLVSASGGAGERGCSGGAGAGRYL